MAYTAQSKILEPVAKLLPPPAMAAFVDAANGASEAGQDHNDCMASAWGVVKENWTRPAQGKRWVRKDNPTSGDVHVDTPLGSKKKPPAGDTSVVTCAKIMKLGDDESRMAYGWASVISENGTPHVDTQGDIISADELTKATTDFMADARMAKAMHEGGKVGEVLHSFPLTADLAKSLGIDCDREGWIVGVKVHDDSVWNAVKSGDLAAFSIGGAATRVPAE